jgi:hypothetical protein
MKHSNYVILAPDPPHIAIILCISQRFFHRLSIHCYALPHQKRNTGLFRPLRLVPGRGGVSPSPPAARSAHRRGWKRTAVLRRAIEQANGWFGFGLDLAETAVLLAHLREATAWYQRPAALGELEISVARRFSEPGDHRLILIHREAWMRQPCSSGSRREVLLIVGGAGGIGSFVIQMAARQGAHVIATGRAEDKEYLRWLGTAETIDYTQGYVIDAVRTSHPDGIHAVLDVATRDGAAFARYAQCLRAGG